MIYHLVDFTVPADHKMKIKESKMMDVYLDHARELKKALEQEGDGDTNCGW